MNKAKKTEGYDSTAAGQIVKGKFVIMITYDVSIDSVHIIWFLFVCFWCMHMLCTVIASSCTKKLFSNIIYTHIHLLNIH